ncbi:MAG: two pore domain potassium channel family protein [Actinobacteria bacterium]|nr:two pore domain potassium channel family protein [Actinomycetota bacterium]
MPASAVQQQGRAIAISLGLVALATAVYYLIPVPGRMREASWALLFSGGVAALGILIATTIWRLLGAGEHVRVRALVLLLVLTVLFFAWCDDSVARLPGQFADLHTKTDALYFTVSTLATVGFGDVHASGQLARVAVTVQMAFNLVFLGAAAAMISGFIRQRAASRLGGPGPDTASSVPDSAGPVPDDQDGAS